jgi:hypothetical protein
MNRLEELVKQGKLFFVPKQYPKYVGDKIRVFKPSVILKLSLVAGVVYAGSR